MQFRPTAKAAKLLSCAALASILPLAGYSQDVKTLTSWDLQTQEDTVKVIRNGMDRFEAANPGFKVEDSHFANDAYKTKLKIAFGADEAPCIFSSWGGGPLREYIKSDQVVDLTPYLDENPEFKDRFMPASFTAVTYEDHIYGLPAETSAVGVIIYNKELFAENDITPPETWDELMDVVAQLQEKNIAPFALANKTKWPGSMYFVYLADRIGGPETFLNAAERAPGGSFEDPTFIKAGEMLQDLVKAGGFARGYNGLDYDIGGSRRLLYSGRAAMELMGTWEFSTIANENPDFADKIGFFPFPSVEGGKGDPNNVVGTLGDNFISIASSCEYPDAAFDLLMHLTDDIAVEKKLEDNGIMPVKNLEVDDPFLSGVMDMVADAPSVQLWYDQELPPALAEVHKDTTQQLLGLSITPEEAAAAMEAAAKAQDSSN
ncbi:extracellular solute-binding protein [Tropicimonas isoalkanivorans]|uniref:Carbohydrate ABC transporter substrate-binding protein, CUT1 family (TC 3.A.1.1.-) n=1 Tax=Tropicimonas isoalkanivorans TaxID=441112 RepID=A0A1I1Q3M3_9RHOB|nr:extracellular solute-binding protein [Tropicimonas isoalkanivorans]SFD16734.1 carbohydrate ABC transporter substrate-binding protein, CUT1 family (TC 3.A.1.1.-) [Tropicimonas isoalkanivorans]